MLTGDFRFTEPAAGFSIVRKTKALTNPERHFHSSWELMYIVSGERTFFHASRTFRIKSGDFLCIRPGVLHRAINRPGETCDLIFLSIDVAGSTWFESIANLLESCASSENPVISIREVDRFRFTKMLIDIGTEFDEKRTGCVELARAILVHCLVELVRYVPPGNIPDEGPQISRRILGVMGWISEHYREEITLSRAAGVFGMSDTCLSRSFRRNTHFSFTEYVNFLRVQEACRLIASTSRAVQDIAEACGFGSITQFGRVFRKITGDSPLSYRKRSSRHG